ncbi:MAG: alpha/beta fold hydrolase [Planctomycetota bacterium]|nr:alpha/beta fold hydrolase [Planctomycetota bacterium]
MDRPQAFVTNLELRESNPDGTEGVGLSHQAGGMLLLHVLELAAYGEPRGCVTVLHDAGDHGGRYEELAHVLAAAGWAIALPDLRGHGQSEGERGHSWGRNEVVRDIDAILDHLAYRMPEEPQVLIGQGLGALYVLAYCLDRPERVAAAVVAAPLLTPRFGLPQKKKGLAGMFKKVGPTSPGSIGWRAEALTTDPAQQSAWSGDALVHDVITLRAGQEAAAMAADVVRRAGAITTPVLILQGTADPLADPAAAQALGNGALEVRLFDGLHHDLFHERGAEEVMQAVRDWIGEKVG